MRILIVIVVGGFGVLVSFHPTRAAGVYVDAAGAVAFLTAPQSKALSGRIARSNGEESDASLYFLDARFPVRSSGLVELNIPAISFIDTSEVVTGFGDLTIRGRVRLYHSSRRVLHLIAALRTGTGTTRVYPYASRSVDLEAGLAYVDTLSVLQMWASGSGAYVSKAPEDVPEEELHGSFGRVGGGLNFPFARETLNVGVGVMVGFFESGRTRELLFSTFDYYRSQWLAFNLFAHIEGGDPEERVSDYAVGGGFRVFY
jgi:hypothetical protein